VHLIPDEIELHEAVLNEPLSCLIHGWDKLNPVNIGSRILVMGAGIIGLLWASLFHLHGFRKTVTISEPGQKRREFASNLGNARDIARSLRYIVLQRNLRDIRVMQVWITALKAPMS